MKTSGYSLPTEFECARCGNCCRGEGYVRITRDEAERIAVYLRMELDDFVIRFCRDPQIAQHREVDDLWLIDKPEEPIECVFLTAAGCEIQSVKPAHCIGFPRRWRTPDADTYCEGLQQ